MVQPSRTEIRPEPTERAGPGERAPWLLGSLLVLAALAVYLPATRAGFVWDDDSYLTRNPLLRSLEGLGRIWIPGNTPQYYPAVFTSFWVERRLWGSDPAGYHAVNVLLHAANALLVWRLARRLAVPAAWWVGALFALHPVHVESVAWITERKNVLSGLFYLLAALAYLRFEDARGAPRRRAPWWYVSALVLFVLALLSKTVACSLPAALVLMMLWRRWRLDAARIAPLVPMFAVGLALGLHTAHLEEVHVGASFDLGLADRSWIAGRALVFYPWKLLVPWPLVFIYPRWELETSDPLAWWPWGVVAGAAAISLAAWRRGARGPALALAFFAGTLVPALGFFDVYPMRYSFVADHFQYLASLGFLALVAGAAAAGADRLGLPRSARWAAGGSVLVVLGALTWNQQAAYRDLQSLWTDVLAKDPDSWLAHNNLGLELHREGRLEEALEHYRAAVRIEPDYPESHHNIGRVRLDQGRYEEAVGGFRRALERKPDYAAAHRDLGTTLHAMGSLRRAVHHYERAAALDPHRPTIRGNLADALMVLGRTGEAVEQYERALRSRPRDADLHHRLGGALLSLGRDREAARHLASAVRLEPEGVPYLTDYAWLLVTSEDASLRAWRRALVLARRAVRLEGDDPAALRALAAAHAERGDFAKAAHWQERALEAAPPGEAAELEHALELYRRGLPLRSPAAGEGELPAGDG